MCVVDMSMLTLLGKLNCLLLCCERVLSTLKDLDKTIKKYIHTCIFNIYYRLIFTMEFGETVFCQLLKTGYLKVSVYFIKGVVNPTDNLILNNRKQKDKQHYHIC